MIADGVKTDNLVAKEMVEKLGLKRARHPYPYRIGWLQGEHALEVREQCLVDFQIGQYKDQVLCDIFDMKSCHVLLGSIILGLCMIFLVMCLL
ncbi:retropepsin-like aspartic protease, partial [Klebsiella pneumoniae]|uniref:retropepsin-like aspartic protease n=1 Tax=Klebsiella pneumoniae TaxID=573 RepID=UPI0035305782